MVIDDHSIIREGIKMLLSKNLSYEVCCEASDGHEALKMLEKCVPNIVILDISLQGISGIEIAKRIKKAHPEIKIIIMSMHKNEAYVYECLSIGVDGYVIKDSAAEDLVAALKAIEGGNSFLSASISRNIINEYIRFASRKSSITVQDILSERERDVIIHIVEGKTAKEIAGILNISSKTVENHKMNIMKKLNIKTTPELIKYAIVNGIVSF